MCGSYIKRSSPNPNPHMYANPNMHPLRDRHAKSIPPDPGRTLRV